LIETCLNNQGTREPAKTVSRLRRTQRACLIDAIFYRFSLRTSHSDSRAAVTQPLQVASHTAGVESVTSSFIAKSYQSSVDSLQTQQVTSIARSFAIVFRVDWYAESHKNTNLPTVDGAGLQLFTRNTASRAINGIETACWTRDVDRIRSGRGLSGAVSRRRHTLAVSSCRALLLLRHCLHVSSATASAMARGTPARVASCHGLDREGRSDCWRGRWWPQYCQVF
jgi:hypothetical protein